MMHQKDQWLGEEDTGKSMQKMTSRFSQVNNRTEIKCKSSRILIFIKSNWYIVVREMQIMTMMIHDSVGNN